MATKVYLEVGSRKVFACALDWPRWCRSGKDEEAALSRLAEYAARYATAPAEAGVRFPKNAGEHRAAARFGRDGLRYPRRHG